MSKQNNESIYLKELKEKSLATLSLFAKNEMILGVPAKVFMMAIGYMAILVLFVDWVAGLVFGLVFYYGMLRVHQNDPKGFDIWRHVLLRVLRNKSSCWTAGKYRSTRLVLI